MTKVKLNKKEYYREYRKKNIEKLQEYQREYYKKNRNTGKYYKRKTHEYSKIYKTIIIYFD